MRGECFTLDGSLSVPETESGIKCCLDWRVDKNSLLSEHRLLYQVEGKCGRWVVKRRRRETVDEWGEERRKGG